jgi:hypothetical protein
MLGFTPPCFVSPSLCPTLECFQNRMFLCNVCGVLYSWNVAYFIYACQFTKSRQKLSFILMREHKSSVFKTPADKQQTKWDLSRFCLIALNKEGHKSVWTFSVRKALTVLRVSVKSWRGHKPENENCPKQGCVVFLVNRPLTDTSIWHKWFRYSDI